MLVNADKLGIYPKTIILRKTQHALTYVGLFEAAVAQLL